jgi:protein TonB
MHLGNETAPGGRRMAAAVATSAIVHALALAVVVGVLRSPVPTTPIVVFPISLVSLAGDGGSPGGGAPAAAPAPPPEPAVAPPVPTAPLAPPRPAPKPQAVAKPERPAPPAQTTAPPGEGTPAPPGVVASSGGAGGGGPGSGAGGRGTDGATPGYGTNPQPPYPVVARRLRLEGTVVLRVVVAADGAPRSVTIASSSGHEALDESAATTVRSRWRFVPASRGGVPVEDTVTVPIQFRIRDDLP